jgi:hypothetical protein
MGSHKCLRLLHGLEAPHPSLPDPRRFMRLLCPVILILLSTVDRVWNQLAMSDPIATQLVCHDLSGFTAVTAQ